MSVFVPSGSGGTVGSAVIGADNIARLNYTIPVALGAGTHTLTTEFTGDATAFASSATGTLMTKFDTLVTVANASGKAGQTVQLRLALRRSPDGVFVQGKTLTFRIDGSVVGTAVIGSDNVARLNYLIPADMSLGTHSFAGEFPGDSGYNPSNGTGTLTVNP